MLVVTFDTVRADAIGCYGNAKARTPVIDGLAQRGARFEQAFSPAPTTLPAHSTLMTGLEPPRHGVRNNGTFVLATEQVTLAERLSSAGYSTGAVVAAIVLDERYGLAQGFASYDDELQEDGAIAGDGHFAQRSADRVTERAIRWLDAQTERPWFLWVHYFDAHAPYAPPAGFVVPQGPPDAPAMFDPDEVRARYQGEVAFADSELGRLLAHLGEERLRRTLVVFTADHGEGLGEHSEFTHSRTIYEASMRVPLVFSCPALFERELVVRDRVAGLVDVAPTVLALLGLDASEAIDGVSLFDTPADPGRAIYGESLVPLYNHGWAPLFSLRRLRDRFIRAPRPEYYDLGSDPTESKNLFGSSAAASTLQAQLERRLASAGSSLKAHERELAPEEAKRLSELGYSRSSSAAARGTLDPKDMMPTWAMLTNAQTFSAQGQFERALSDVERVLKLNPNDPFAWETSYVVNFRRKEYALAEQALRRTLELNPNCDGYVRLGQLLLTQYKPDEVPAVIEAAEKLDPRHGEIFLLRGDMYAAKKEFELAREQYEKAREVDPVRASAGAKVGLAYVETQLAAQPAK